MSVEERVWASQAASICFTTSSLSLCPTVNMTCTSCLCSLWCS